MDRHDTTTFNAVQLRWLLEELMRLLDQNQPRRRQRLLHELAELCRHSVDGAHTFLVFLGD